MELKGKRVLVTGGGGFLGRRVVQELKARGVDAIVVRSADSDLRDPPVVRRVLEHAEPGLVVHCAAVVGGIGANRAHPARFFYENAVMGLHLIHEAWRSGVEKLVVVGTVCSYPKFATVPFREAELWVGYPEETNAPYGLAKRMLLVQGQAYRSEYGFNCVHVIPTNLYGPGENFDPRTSHVIPALIRKCLDAKRRGDDEVVLWGTGAATREFLHVSDAALGIVLALERYNGPDPINLGGGEEISIGDLAQLIKQYTEFEGRFRWDPSQPDGQPRRKVDASFAQRELGWVPKVNIREGLRQLVAEIVAEGA